MVAGAAAAGARCKIAAGPPSIACSLPVPSTACVRGSRRAARRGALAAAGTGRNAAPQGA